MNLIQRFVKPFLIIIWIPILLTTQCIGEDSDLITPRSAEQPTQPSSSSVQEVSQNPIPLSEGYIVFVSNRDGNEEIYSMNIDGSEQIRLTNNPSSDRYPSWSPDGKFIAFQSNRDKNYEIYIINKDGNDILRLTNSDASDTHPAWSPDGEWIAFMSDRNGYSDIYIIRRDGSEILQVTNSSAIDAFPTWSPDGLRILFASTRDNPVGISDSRLYSVSIDGQDLIPVNNNFLDYEALDWSPDNQQIIYSTRHPAKLYKLFLPTQETSMLLDDDPSLPIALLPSESDPSWSLDGNQIVFTIANNNNSDIYILTIADHQLTQLTNDSASNWAPDWGK